jgi:hypothetical protein
MMYVEGSLEGLTGSGRGLGPTFISRDGDVVGTEGDTGSR